MQIKSLNFTGTQVGLHFGANSASFFSGHPDAGKYIFVTDEKLPALYPDFFSDKQFIPIVADESRKVQATVDHIIAEMLALEVDKKNILVGIGGGIVTDITGYVAAIYKRGIGCILMPTSVLAMVDAAVGGKNGVNVQSVKNMAGTIKQPQQIIFDFDFLKTLPRNEWINGFAEIIKHACIKDEELFNRLQKFDIAYFMNNEAAMSDLIQENVAIKSKIVMSDELESGERMLLNFGHSFGHAIEQVAGIAHGAAISIGMMVACKISERVTGFSPASTEKITALLQKYHLPTSLLFEKEKVWQALLSDKKRAGLSLHFILLNQIGVATVKPILLTDLKMLWEDIT